MLETVKFRGVKLEIVLMRETAMQVGAKQVPITAIWLIQIR